MSFILQEKKSKGDTMPEVQIIMGDSQVGKSRTIRALTGVFKSIPSQIKTKDGKVIDVFVQIRALQEDGISPEEFIKEHDSDKYILLGLRVNGGHRNPHGLDYIEKLRSHGWNIKDIYVLGRELSDLPFSLPHDISAYSIKDSKSMPANEIACKIRERWGWL